MNNHNLRSLLHLFEPSLGPCVSIYIPKVPGSTQARAEQAILYAALQNAKNALKNKLEVNEIKKLLSPIEKYSLQSDFLSLGCRGVALFSSEHFFWSLPLPINIKPISVVSKSFHIKPIVKWLHLDRKSWIFKVNSNEIQCYRASFRGIHSRYKLPLKLNVNNKLSLASELKDFVNKKQLNPSEDLIILSASPLTPKYDEILSVFKEFEVYLLDLSLENLENDLDHVVLLRIQEILTQSSFSKDYSFVKSMISDLEDGSQDIVQHLNSISRFASQGVITDLVVSYEDHVLGELNTHNGSLKIAPQSYSTLAESKEDVLDDLIELAGKKGARVRVVSKSLLPNGIPAIARIQRKVA